MIAIAVLWPAATRDPIRVKAIAGCRAIAERLRREIAFIVARGAAEAMPGYRAAIAAADDAVSDLYRTFLQTPYRPTGLTTERPCRGPARRRPAVVQRDRPARPDGGAPASAHTTIPRVMAVKQAASEVLDRCAELLGIAP